MTINSRKIICFVVLPLSLFLLTSFFPHAVRKSPLPFHTEPVKEIKADIKLITAKKNLPLVDSALMAWHNNKHLNGAVLVAIGGEVVYEDYFGYAIPKTKVKIQPNSAFQIASVSKVFTGVSVLILKDRGLLRLDDSIQTYLPDFPYHDITIRHLLSHQSGLPNYVYALLPKLREISNPSNSEWYALFINAGLKPLFAPGKKFHYCNTNYALLAYLVEKISGMKFSMFLKKEIFEPLGMKNSFTYPESHLRTNTCHAFTKKGKPESTDANDYILGDKGIFSTPSDLLKFSVALHTGKILSKETYKEATTPQANEYENKDYGLGFRLRNSSDSLNKDIYHNGWWHGYRSAFHYYPADDLYIIMLSNQLDKHVYYTSIIRGLIMGHSAKSNAQPQDDDI
ncbi:MAG: beta-lactamase family protein [Bacteroidia bacterium]|nr:beta-lactamase family protein [Bacteroidia bacterium]